MSNTQSLERLFQSRSIHLVRGALFDTPPPPLPSDLDFQKLEGMMLGLAIGDALGNTTEGQLPAQRGRVRGEIRDYLPNLRAAGVSAGLPSDDSQLAFWTLEQLIADAGFVPEHLASRFASRRIFGIGGTVQRFLSNYEGGLPWYECGVPSAGNGALMRIAPMLVPHVRTPSVQLWADTALGAMLTHNDAGSTSACLAFVAMLWQLLAMNAPPSPSWWLEAYVQTTRDLEGDTLFEPRTDAIEPYEGPLWQFTEQQVQAAYERDASTLDACNHWHSGAYLLETMPCVIYILMRHGHDPEEAIVRAVNDTRDNDTIAAIVGAAIGALHGKSVLPQRWITRLLGRTTGGDNGRVFALLDAARRTWWD